MTNIKYVEKMHLEIMQVTKNARKVKIKTFLNYTFKIDNPITLHEIVF